eukprot:SAG31_NODE_1302_length_8900_cov_4.460857_8_plen_155_part_01
MQQYTLRGVAVDFPFRAYEPQLRYMEAVIESLQRGANALLESPTGTGKTLCLLCASLAWQKNQRQHVLATDKSQLAQQSPNLLSQPAACKIIYASRTHSQLQQVVRELKLATRGGKYSPSICVLGSRDQTCVHPEVRKMRGAQQKNACAALCAAQ